MDYIGREAVFRSRILKHIGIAVDVNPVLGFMFRPALTCGELWPNTNASYPIMSQPREDHSISTSSIHAAPVYTRAVIMPCIAAVGKVLKPTLTQPV